MILISEDYSKDSVRLHLLESGTPRLLSTTEQGRQTFPHCVQRALGRWAGKTQGTQAVLLSSPPLCAVPPVLFPSQVPFKKLINKTRKGHGGAAGPHTQAHRTTTNKDLCHCAQTADSELTRQLGSKHTKRCLY